MKHRKYKHEPLVRTCSNFLQNKCERQNNTCWFIHKDEAMDTDSMEKKNEYEDNQEDEVKSSSVFQKVLKKIEPPLMKNYSNQKME